MSESAIAAIKNLVATKTLPDLGPTRRAEALPESELNARLTAALRDTDFAHQQQELIRALLLLWHDHLDASHEISQDIETADGSFVHAIMHRREPDYWNAKYWWRRVGSHSTFPKIASRVNELLQSQHQNEWRDKLLPAGKWNPDAFVDACEQAARDASANDLLQQVQRIETEVLLDSFLAKGRAE